MHSVRVRFDAHLVKLGNVTSKSSKRLFRWTGHRHGHRRGDVPWYNPRSGRMTHMTRWLRWVDISGDRRCRVRPIWLMRTWTGCSTIRGTRSSSPVKRGKGIASVMTLRKCDTFRTLISWPLCAVTKQLSSV